MADKTKTENTAITTVQPSGETRTATELVPAVLPMVPAVGTDKWKETLKRLLHLASPSELAQIASDPDVAELLTEIDEQVLPMRKLDKVAIVGFASHWNLAPFNDPSYEIWSLNEFYDVAKEQCSVAHSEGRLRWFEIHRREQSYEGNPFFLHSRNTNHAEKLAGMNCPVYMHKKWDDIKTSLAYPLRTIITSFQFGGYLTNTISEMIALAIWEGFKEIAIYGVDMAQEGEYAAQRPSCEYWIGVAVGKGIKVVLPEASDLMKTPYIYGWESHLIDAYHQKSESRLGELRQRRTHNEQVMQQARDAANQLLGAEENTRYMKAAYGGIRAGKPTT